MALDAKQLADLLKLRAIGWSQKDIAEAIGISQQVVAYQLKKLREASLKKGVDDVFFCRFTWRISRCCRWFCFSCHDV